MRAVIIGFGAWFAIASSGCERSEASDDADDTGDAIEDVDSTDGTTPEDVLDAADASPDDGGPEADADGVPDDAGRSLPASLTDETRYEGSTTCSAPTMTAASPAPGQVVVTLLQIPAADVRGTCIGHSATATLLGSEIAIAIDGPTGSVCWTSCWDFEIVVSGVPEGSYTVRFLGLSDTVSVALPLD